MTQPIENITDTDLVNAFSQVILTDRRAALTMFAVAVNEISRLRTELEQAAAQRHDMARDVDALTTRVIELEAEVNRL